MKSPAWTRKAGKNPSGGLNEAGRRSYEAGNPGSNLKAPVKAGIILAGLVSWRGWAICRDRSMMRRVNRRAC